MDDSEGLKIVFYFVLVFVGFIVILEIVNFLTTPQTGNIGGYPITMPGFTWVGMAAFFVVSLILYVKSRM